MKDKIKNRLVFQSCQLIIAFLSFQISLTNFYDRHIFNDIEFPIQTLGLISSILIMLSIYFDRFKVTSLLFAIAIQLVVQFSLHKDLEAWNYTTHVYAVSFFSIVGHKISDPKVHTSLARIIPYILAFVYLQAGLSKIIHGFDEWILSGKAIESTLALNLNTKIPEFRYQQFIFHFLGIATVIGELVLFPILTFQKTRQYGVYLALLFHGGIYCIFSISFWHLVFLLLVVAFPDRYINNLAIPYKSIGIHKYT